MTVEVKPVHLQLSVEKGVHCEHKAVFGIKVVLAKQYGDRKWSANAVREMKGSTPLVASWMDRLELLIPSSSST